jgi:hypothetical protein
LPLDTDPGSGFTGLVESFYKLQISSRRDAEIMRQKQEKKKADAAAAAGK